MGLLKVIHDDQRSDQELVQRYKQTADLQLLADLYQRYMHLVYGVCLKYFHDPEESKDAVMNIFEELVTKLKIHEVENFRNWLHVLAKNHCLMRLRKKNRVRTSEVDPDIMQSAEELHHNGVMDKEQRLTMMEDCMETLPEDQKRSVQLFYLENKCYNEIAELTGLNGIRSEPDTKRQTKSPALHGKKQHNSNSERIFIIRTITAMISGAT
jgi:RNA polymerase sigma-70 factor (ECF subfamily)